MRSGGADMSEITIYHNPKCSKSRQTLQLLNDNGVEPTIVEYLKSPLSKGDVIDLISKYNGEHTDLVRTKEEDFKQNTPDISSSEGVAAAIEQFPKLLERPIVVKGDVAVIGRPPENVMKLLI
jgi:arsenate reductase